MEDYGSSRNGREFMYLIKFLMEHNSIAANLFMIRIGEMRWSFRGTIEYSNLP